MQHLDEGTIHAWLDGALGTTQALEAEQHVGACRACAERVAEARGLIAASSRILTALDHVPADVVPATARHVAAAAAAPAPMVAAAASHTASEAPAAPRSRWGHRFARIAAVIALVAAGTLVVTRESEHDTLPRSSAAAPMPERAPVRDSTAVASARPALAPPSPSAVQAPPPAVLGGAIRREAPAPGLAAKSATAARRSDAAQQSAGDAGVSAFGAARDTSGATSTAMQGIRSNAARALETKLSAETKQAADSTTPRLVASDTVRRGAITVWRQTYEVGTQHVVLETQPPAVAPNGHARASVPPSAAPAADSAAVGTDTTPVVIRVIRWRGADGTGYTLSGPLSTDALERVRAALGKG